MNFEEVGRSKFWDLVKGVSIISVVLIHTTGVDTIGGVIWRQFINFPVSIFFFVAGYFCRYDGGYKAYLRKKIRRLAVPFVVFSIVYAGFDVYLKVRKGVVFSHGEWLASLVSFPSGWGYFVLSLFQCILLSPFINRLSYKGRVFMAMVSYCSAYVYYFVGCLICTEFHLCRYMMPFILCLPWLPMFILGMSIKNMVRLPVNQFVLMLLAGVSLLLSVLEGCVFFYANSLEMAFSQIKPFSIIFSLMIALYCWHIRLIKVNATSHLVQGLCLLGKYSFFVYLSHRLVLILVRGFCASISADAGIYGYPFIVLAIELFVLLMIGFLPEKIKRHLWVVGI